MKAVQFEYARPKDVAEAVKLLAEGGDGAKCAAGTQSLGPMLNLRVVQPTMLVDLRHIEELKAVTDAPDAVTYGACTTHAAVEDGRVPDPTGGFLREIASNIAYRPIRNRGTMGGSLVHADPAADWPSTMLLLGATMIAAGPAGRREIPVESFFSSIFETALKPGELLVGIRVPKRGAKARRAYWKFCRKTGEFPQAIGAALLDPDKGESRAVIGATLSTPILLSNAKALLAKPTDEALGAAADEAGFADDPYNRRLHAVALRRAIERLSA